MRKRSEITKKPTAATRTVDIPFRNPKDVVQCPVCEESARVDEHVVDTKGGLECPSCGAPVEGKVAPKTIQEKADLDQATAYAEENKRIAARDAERAAQRTKPAPFQTPMSEARAKAVLGIAYKDHERAEDGTPNGLVCSECGEPQFTTTSGETCKNGHGGADGVPVFKPNTKHDPPPKTYCSECGAEWSIVKGAPWQNCGHAVPSTDHPGKARVYAPPAGTPRASITGRTIAVTRGRHTFPTVAYGSFHVGPFVASAEVAPGEDMLAVAATLRDNMRKIADAAFEEELEWYTQKLEVVKGE